MSKKLQPKIDEEGQKIMDVPSKVKRKVVKDDVPDDNAKLIEQLRSQIKELTTKLESSNVQPKAKTTKAPRKLGKKKLEEIKRIEELPKRKVGLPSDVSTKALQKHQIEFSENLINGDIKGGMAIHGVGTGKTLTAVISAELFLAKYPDNDVYVITPASLLAGFKQELYTYDKAIEKDDRYKFYTYDGFSNAIKRGDKDINCKDNMLIIDEGQNLRTQIKFSEDREFDINTNSIIVRKTIKSGAKVLRILEECAMKAKKVLILSATPMVNKPEDIENIMAMINQHVPLDSKTFAFDSIWKNPKVAQQYFGCRLSFFENSPEVRNKYFPSVQEMQVPIVMNKNTLSAYETIEKEKPSKSLRKELGIDEDSKKINTFYVGVRKASNAIDGINSQKFNFILNWIIGVKNDKPDKSIGLTEKIIKSHNKKFIIFTHFLETGINLIADKLRSEEFKVGIINGSISKPNREKVVNDYVNGDTDVIIISKAGAEGLNLLETGYIFIVESGWNNAEHDQVVGRGVRFMSHINLPVEKRNVLVLNLFLIKPKEKPIFQKLISSEPLTEEESKKLDFTPASVDIYIYNKANDKQRFIDTALNELRKTDPLEDCKLPSGFMDVSNIFDFRKDSTTLPASPKWENDFYKEFAGDTDLPVNDLSIELKEVKPIITSINRSVFGGQKELVKAQNAFFTPQSIAKDMIEFSGIKKAEKDILFLEPTAGSGNLIFEALSATEKAYCDCVEPIPQLRQLLSKFPRTQISDTSNFFEFEDEYKYSLIIMNPPFNIKKGLALKDRNTYDVDFVMKAFNDHLKTPAILVCLISSKFEFAGLDKKSPKKEREAFGKFRDMLKANEHYIVNYESGFSHKESEIKEMATSVSMRMIKIFKK